MEQTAKNSRLHVRNGWVQCPVCKRNKRLLRVTQETRAQALRVYCYDCKNELILDITGQSVERRSQ